MRPHLHLLTDRRRRQPAPRDGAPGPRHNVAPSDRRPGRAARGRTGEIGASRPAAALSGERPVAVWSATDEAARRVREAGGPVDEAQYSCSCGFIFAAPVSTTVACPHCGDRQAW